MCTVMLDTQARVPPSKAPSDDIPFSHTHTHTGWRVHPFLTDTHEVMYTCAFLSLFSLEPGHPPQLGGIGVGGSSWSCPDYTLI